MRLGQTRVALARRARLSETRIIAVESGDPDVDLLQLVAIADALQISLRRLLRRAERKVGWRAREGNGGVTTKRLGKKRRRKTRRK